MSSIALVFIVLYFRCQRSRSPLWYVTGDFVLWLTDLLLLVGECMRRRHLVQWVWQSGPGCPVQWLSALFVVVLCQTSVAAGDRQGLGQSS